MPREWDPVMAIRMDNFQGLQHDAERAPEGSLWPAAWGLSRATPGGSPSAPRPARPYRFSWLPQLLLQQNPKAREEVGRLHSLLDRLRTLRLDRTRLRQSTPNRRAESTTIGCALRPAAAKAESALTEQFLPAGTITSAIQALGPGIQRATGVGGSHGSVQG